jgi:hypothetical protein
MLALQTPKCCLAGSIEPKVRRTRKSEFLRSIDRKNPQFEPAPRDCSKTGILALQTPKFYLAGSKRARKSEFLRSIDRKNPQFEPALRPPPASFPDDLYKYSFTALAVELTVKNLFPWAKVQFASADRRNHFPPHNGAFKMGVGVYFPGIVAVRRDRLMRGQFFQPHVKVVVQAGFIIVDKNAGGNMHSVYQTQTLLYARLAQEGFNFAGNIDKFTGFWRIEPQFLAERFHALLSIKSISVSRFEM